MKIIKIIPIIMCLLILSNLYTIIADSNEYDPPIIQLIHPKGGEELNEIINIQWIAYHSDNTYEHLKINIYYRIKNSEPWIEIIKFLPNIGEYNWSTHNLLDDNYIIRILAIDGDNNIGIATSEEFTLINGNKELEIADIIIKDKTINNSEWVKDCDNITIHAIITGFGADKLSINNITDNITIHAIITGFGADKLSINNITADLTDFNMGKNVKPNNYDGKNAIWELYYVKCNFSTNQLCINIEINNYVNKNCTINVDNENPKLNINKPTKGIYLYNKKLFIPIEKTIIFGKIDIELDFSDNCEIDRLEILIDGKLELTLHENYYKFEFNKRLIGRHFIEFCLYDLAENRISKTMVINFFNLL